VRSHLVVVSDEAIDLGLELCDRGGPRLLAEKLLEGLVEALDLAAGLGVIGPRVLVVDAEAK
jgi:hypothetical protein